MLWIFRLVKKRRPPPVDVIEKYAGALTGVYRADELEVLRNEWPSR